MIDGRYGRLACDKLCSWLVRSASALQTHESLICCHDYMHGGGGARAHRIRCPPLLLLAAQTSLQLTMSSRNRRRGNIVGHRVTQPTASAAATSQPWRKVVDKASGRPYYVNTVTRAVSWTPPPGVPASQPSSAPPQQQANPDLKGWRIMRDPSSGRPFYHNTVSGEKRWTPPDVMRGVPAAALVAKQSTVPRSANARRLLEATRRARRDKPVQAASNGGGGGGGGGGGRSAVSAAEDSIARARRLVAGANQFTLGGMAAMARKATATKPASRGTTKGDWVKLDHKGRPYYYNAKLKKTQWTAPPEFAASRTATTDNGSGSGSGSGSGWVRLMDKKRGKPYYFNKQLNKTQWNPPPGFADSTNAARSTKPARRPRTASDSTRAASDDAGGGSDGEWEEHYDPKRQRPFYRHKVTKQSVWRKPTSSRQPEGRARSVPPPRRPPGPPPQSGPRPPPGPPPAAAVATASKRRGAGMATPKRRPRQTRAGGGGRRGGRGGGGSDGGSGGGSDATDEDVPPTPQGTPARPPKSWAAIREARKVCRRPVGVVACSALTSTSCRPLPS